MMPSSSIQHRIETRNSGRPSPGNTPVCAGSARLARDRTANPVEQRAIRSCTPAPTPKIRANAIQSPASP